MYTSKGDDFVRMLSTYIKRLELGQVHATALRGAVFRQHEDSEAHHGHMCMPSQGVCEICLHLHACMQQQPSSFLTYLQSRCKQCMQTM